MHFVGKVWARLNNGERICGPDNDYTHKSLRPRKLFQGHSKTLITN